MSDFCSVPQSVTRSLSTSALKYLRGALTLVFPMTGLAVALFSVPAVRVSAQAPTPVPVTSWRYDNTHAGQNTSETALTPANVNPTTFGKLFTLKVDSTMYAQPLYMPGLTMSDGKVHNVVFLATENDSLYAFDADSNGGTNAAPIWQVTLLDAAHGAGAGATAVPADAEGIKPQGDIGPTIGITGTAAINPATNTMYVVANSIENGVYYSRLHAINILNGAEQSAPAVTGKNPVAITATVAGTGMASTNGQLAFDPLISNQRPALGFYNGYVYVGYAAHGDIGPWHGWLFSYNGATMAQSAALCLSPNNEGAGIWASGAGLPIDADGAAGAARMFVVTGNNGQTQPANFPPYTTNTQYGESILDFNIANGALTPVDGFSSFNSSNYLDAHDYDQGSGGILMVPDQAGANPHILITAGKEGRILVLNRDALGGNQTGKAANTGDLQDITGQTTGLWSTPAYWNGNVYIWGSKGYPELFTLTNGVLSTTPTSSSTLLSDFPAPSFIISSNGTQDGIAWAVKSDQYVTYGQSVLYAWPANDLSTPLYESDTNSTRDAVGQATKFALATVTNGKVYVIAHNQVSVYGLFNGEPTAVAPVITPNGGTFAAGQSVTLKTTTPNAQIFYTLDGSVPTPSETLYTAPIDVETDTTLRAVASAAGYIQSPVSSAVFNFSDQTPLISFAPAGGTYASVQQVTLADADANAKIYYTVNGSTPTAASTLYTGPIKVALSETINAIAIDPALADSDIGTSSYVIQAGGNTINFANGFAATTGLQLNGSVASANDSRLQLTDGGLNEAGSVFWNKPINIQAFTTSFTFQLSDAQANGFTFTVQNNTDTALGGDSAGLGYQGIPNSVAVKFNFYDYMGEGNDSTGFYTDGVAPVLPTIDISPSNIELNSDDGLTATIIYDGTTLTLNLADGVTNKTFTTSTPMNIPQVVGGNTAYVGFTGGSGGLSASQKLTSWVYTTQALPPTASPAAGTYSGPQTVALASATGDASLYYTVDGTTPNAGSIDYSGPIAVQASETVNAIAISPTLGTSAVSTAAYVIQNPAPSFTMTGGAAVTVAPGATSTANIKITPAAGFTGSVSFTCAVTTSPAGSANPPTCPAQASTVAGTAVVPVTLSINTLAATTVGNYTLTVTGTAAGGLAETTTVTLTVAAVVVPPVTPSFGLSPALAITLASAGATGTSTVTITPSGGFTGAVAVACALTSSPAGATDLPTCAATQPAAIASTAPVTSTVTVTTTAALTSALHNPLGRIFSIGGGGTVVALLLFGMPLRRRRRWQALLGLVALLVISAAAATGCGGGSGSHTTNAGTTPGSYTLTVTATSGSITVPTPITVTVQ